MELAREQFLRFLKNGPLRFHLIFLVFDTSEPLSFSDVLIRSIKAYLCPNMINFDWVNFSTRRSEKVMFLLTLGVFTELAFTNAIWHVVTKLLVYAGRKKLFSLLTKCKQMDMQQNNQANCNYCNIEICYYLFVSTLTQKNSCQGPIA